MTFLEKLNQKKAEWGLYLIAIALGFSCIYAQKFLSFLMPAFTLLVIWKHGGFKAISFKVSLPIVLLLLLLAWGAVGLWWAVDLAVSSKVILATSVTLLFSWLFLSACQKATSGFIDRAYKVMVIAGIVLFILITFQLVVDTYQISFLKFVQKNSCYFMKPTAQILGLAAFVGCSFLWVRGERELSFMSFVALVLMIFASQCDTAFIGILLASLGFVLSYKFPFWITRLSMVGSFLISLLSPLLFATVLSPSFLISKNLIKAVPHDSFFHRMLAWEYYANLVMSPSLWGTGAGSARYLPTAPGLSADYSNVLHPHNNSLQIYVELGIVGGILISLFFASLFWLVSRKLKDRLSIAVCNATIIFAFITAEVTSSVWSNFWLSFVALVTGLCILFVKFREGQLREKGDR